MAYRYFLVKIQVPEFTYMRTTATSMLQNNPSLMAKKKKTKKKIPINLAIR